MIKKGRSLMGKFEHWHSPFEGQENLFSDALKAQPFTAQVNLRGNPDDGVFNGWVKDSLDLELPLEPNRISEGKGCKALWLGPDEWLVIGSDEGLASDLSSPPDGLHSAVTDVSANRVILELSGPHARDVLSKSCELDFHPRVFGTGMVVQTLLAKSQAIIEQVGGDRYHLYVRNSFARYVAEWLSDALLEFQ